MAEGAVSLADYSLASGIFNVNLACPLPVWEELVAGTLVNLKRHSRLGYAVNFILPAAEGQASPPELYRPPPARWIAHAEALGGRVQLIGRYGLPEYTLLVETRG